MTDIATADEPRVKHFDDELDFTGLRSDELARSIQICIYGHSADAADVAADWMRERGYCNARITSVVSECDRPNILKIRVTLTDYGLPQRNSHN